MNIDLPEFLLLVMALAIVVYTAMHDSGRRRRRG